MYSSPVTITTTDTGSPIDNLREDISEFESASKQKLDMAESKKNELVSTLTEAEKTLNSAKNGGVQEISDMSDKISQNFVGVQQKSSGKHTDKISKC